ncbi:hypothetical protein [Lonsdalea quercina]|uniref:hypothetical protein n=1 Tax=Lonsdalea quercina TaxID=71657 RepID=UPI0039760F5C
MDLWLDLEDALKRYQDNISFIKQCIRKYERRCEELIETISAKEFNDCQEDFNELFGIQRYFATALYKYDFHPEKKITDFIYYMDRDDIYSRKFWFEKFKEGQKWPSD